MLGTGLEIVFRDGVGLGAYGLQLWCRARYRVNS